MGIKPKGPITGPATRWTYGPKYLRRALELEIDMWEAFVVRRMLPLRTYGTKYYEIDSHFITNLTEFHHKRSLIEYFMVLFDRIEFWIVRTESGHQPTLSMVIYAMDDIERLVFTLTDKIRNERNQYLLSQNEEGDEQLLQDIAKAVDEVLEVLEIFYEFQTNFRKVFVDDMKDANGKGKGKNDLYFRKSKIVRMAKFLDIRFTPFDANGELNIDCDIGYTLCKEYYTNRFIGDINNTANSQPDQPLPTIVGNIRVTNI